MPIDESVLQTKRDSVLVLLHNTRDKLNDIEHVFECLDNIIQIDNANPIDSRTGTTMTDTTRQEIYDACIADANELLGTTSD